MKRALMALAMAALLASAGAAGCAARDIAPVKEVRVDSVPEADARSRYQSLTDEDFRMVAEELGVEVAAMKAVVEIEAGKQMKGFWAPGVPVVNFDRSMYNRFRRGSGSQAGDKTAKVPDGLSGYALKEWTQLVNARRVNARGADMGTFWGMFQIGGFNYKLCGCSSIEEFVKLMSYSELEQLELFAAFLVNTGMIHDLRAKNWASFARKYNGAGYARRGYHTRMATAYRKYRQLQPAQSGKNAASGEARDLTPRPATRKGNSGK